MATSATITSSYDKRNAMADKPVWQAEATFVWQTGDGHAAQSVTLNELNGIITGVSISITSVTDNPTVDVTLKDGLGTEMIAFSGLADGSTHWKDEGDFNQTPVAGDVTLSVDPSADPGGSGQTLTVIVQVRGV